MDFIEDPFIAYFKIVNNTNSLKEFTVGETIGDFNNQYLFDLSESEILNEAINSEHVFTELFPKLKIKFPYCWMVVEIDTRKISDDPLFENGKPGDIDLIVGNFESDYCTPSFENIVGIQLKIRKIKSTDDLKNFSSGHGTKQTYNTALMGFDRVLLLHLLIKEPYPLNNFETVSFQSVINSVHVQHFHRTIGTINPKLSNDLYGYAIIGWGQPQNNHWNYAGTVKTRLISDPPVKNWMINDQIHENREKLVESLKYIFQNLNITTYPYIVNR